MKTYKHLWEQLISEENFRRAESNSIKGKGRQRGVQAYMKDPDGKREALRQAVITGTYRTSRYASKTIHEPKTRVIYKLPYYPDRLLHHALMNVLRPIFEEKFIQNSYACQKGKGPLKASLKCSEMVRRFKYCLQCDIRKFYPSVDQEILSRQLHRIIRDERFMRVLDDIIFSFPGGKNVPIGNYTSQWLANYYLTGLDNFILHGLKPGGYIRYNDDFLIFDNDKGKLRECRQRVEEYIRENLALEFSRADVFHTRQGVDFCGYRHFGKYVLIRKATARRLKRRYRGIRRQMERGGWNRERIAGQVASGNGLMRHACSYHLRKAIGHDEIWEKVREDMKEREEKEHETDETEGRDDHDGPGREQCRADPCAGAGLCCGGHAEGADHPGEPGNGTDGKPGVSRGDSGIGGRV